MLKVTKQGGLRYFKDVGGVGKKNSFNAFSDFFEFPVPLYLTIFYNLSRMAIEGIYIIRNKGNKGLRQRTFHDIWS